jgi:hypothetical protein
MRPIPPCPPSHVSHPPTIQQAPPPPGPFAKPKLSLPGPCTHLRSSPHRRHPPPAFPSPNNHSNLKPSPHTPRWISLRLVWAMRAPAVILSFARDLRITNTRRVAVLQCCSARVAAADGMAWAGLGWDSMGWDGMGFPARGGGYALLYARWEPPEQLGAYLALGLPR